MCVCVYMCTCVNTCVPLCMLGEARGHCPILLSCSLPYLFGTTSHWTWSSPVHLDCRAGGLQWCLAFTRMQGIQTQALMLAVTGLLIQPLMLVSVLTGENILSWDDISCFFPCVDKEHSNSCHMHTHARTILSCIMLFEAADLSSVVLGKDRLLDFVAYERKKKKPCLPLPPKKKQCAAVVRSVQGMHTFFWEKWVCVLEYVISSLCHLEWENATSAVWRGREVFVWNLNRPGHCKDVFSLSCLA